MESTNKDPVIERLEYADGKATDVPATGNVNLLDDQGNVRRIPIPSADSNDPLNMAKWRKLGIIVTCCWYSIFSLVLVGGAGPILPFFIDEYASQGYAEEEVVRLTTYPSLVMALGAFLILPASIVFGRRPVMLGCCILILGSAIGAAKSQSYSTHMACRILQGVATGATESILPLVITDVSFLDERGLLFGFYWGTQNLVNAVFTIAVSYLAADMGWRWFYWLLTIFCALGGLLAFFCLPETRYHRSATAIGAQICRTDEFGMTHVLSGEEAQQYIESETQPEDVSQRTRRSYMKDLSPVSEVAPHPFRLAVSVILKMLAALSSPAVVWAILASSISLGVGISITLTYGTVLTQGFGWSQASVGLVNAGIFPAALMSMFWAGWLGDKTNLWLAKRRGGIHFPEDSLVTLVFPTVVSMVGIIIYATAANSPETHNSWGIIMGWTLYEFGFIVCLITSTHFAAEAYPSNPGPALVLVVGVKNIVSFGIPARLHYAYEAATDSPPGASFGITPMVHEFNYLTAYMILFGIFSVIYLMGIPIYFLNPKWRAMVARKEVK